MKLALWIFPLGLMAIYAVFTGILSPEPQLSVRPKRIGDILHMIVPTQSLLVDSEGIVLVAQENKEYLFQAQNPVFKVSFWVGGLVDRIVHLDGSIGDADTTQNGFPDIAELYGEDCEIFREWFVGIAKYQKQHISPLWNDQDCSGLVRFAYREALRRHDTAWAVRAQIPQLYARDIQAFHYPNIPILGDNIFLTESGFGNFANARNLLLYHCRKIDTQRSPLVKPGDLIFFFHPHDLLFPYHVMIYTGDGLVYHTGPTEDSQGEVRLWTWEAYFQGAPLEWLPTRENPYFLGFYRFKILND